jgi:hypothetical protein
MGVADEQEVIVGIGSIDGSMICIGFIGYVHATRVCCLCRKHHQVSYKSVCESVSDFVESPACCGDFAFSETTKLRSPCFGRTSEVHRY